MPKQARTLEAIADRLEIDDLLTRYTVAIDSKTFDLLDDVFTPDARLDYTSSGGLVGQYPDVKKWLSEVLQYFPAYQHYVTNPTVIIDGDRATSVAKFYNPMRSIDGHSMFYVGGEYRDVMVRTADGWRIAERVEVSIWTDGEVPEPPV
jgi:hypothetical protein